jgi:hypothetical protein
MTNSDKLTTDEPMSTEAAHTPHELGRLAVKRWSRPGDRTLTSSERDRLILGSRAVVIDGVRQFEYLSSSDLEAKLFGPDGGAILTKRAPCYSALDESAKVQYLASVAMTVWHEYLTATFGPTD